MHNGCVSGKAFGVWCDELVALVEIRGAVGLYGRDVSVRAVSKDGQMTMTS